MPDKPKKKRKITKPRKAAKPPATKAPDELEHVWDDDTQEAWGKLNQKQQDFFIAWLRNGYNATEAYRTAYNKLENDDIAKPSGSRLLSNVNLQELAGKISESKKTDLIAIKRVYTDGMEAFKPHFAKTKDKDGNETFDNVGEFEDHAIRIKAAESLARLNGELMERSENTLNITKNLTINHNVIADMNNYLTKQGHEPIKQSNGEVIAPQSIQPVVEEEDFESFGDDNMQVLGND